MTEQELRLKLRIERLRRKVDSRDKELGRVYYLASRLADCAAEAKSGRITKAKLAWHVKGLSESILGGDA